jgi:excinuclease ABC subunit A
MDKIRIRGARTHNLQNIDLDLPRNQLVVLTGLSGSGKSSLAFDTLYAEGQRRYVESLSAYARQFLTLMEKPDVDAIEGLSPAISIGQQASSHNPRSTVGTLTEIHDYLRLLFARIGIPHCPEHGEPLVAQTITQMVDRILTQPQGEKWMLLAPVVSERKGDSPRLFAELNAQGFVRARIDGALYELDTPPVLDAKAEPRIEVVVDRFRIRADRAQRLAESLETALALSGGLARLVAMEGPEAAELLFSANFACPLCAYRLNELEPRLFSFNNPAGACPACDGLGYEPPSESDSPEGAPLLCSVCNGARLNQAARHVRIEAKNLPELSSLPISDCLRWFETLALSGQRAAIGEKIVHAIVQRLRFLADVGLTYLSLSRRADTLSGGEAQRIRLASQIGAGLVGVMYILDEPSIGLHQRDNARLLDTLRRLRDSGNTVIVVEHDEDAMHAADWIVDLGPGAGARGGRIIAQGTADAIMATPDSLTGQYLSGARCIERPEQHRPADGRRWLRLLGASGNNLRDIDIAIPVGAFCAVTGVSGSGKSTLINDTLYPILARALHQASIQGAPYRELQGLEHFDKVIDIDQSPIGRTPRSNTATYTGLLGLIRELFAAVPEARARGYGPGRFSFNVKGGRCEACQGDGLIRVEMHFLPDLHVPCEACGGRRYNRETLEIRYKGKRIDEVLNLTVEDALGFFAPVPQLRHKLDTLMRVGLSYIALGQSATTLSGGEAQRIKLSRELSRRDTGRTLYILDEPTTGLHFEDVRQLLAVLHQLCERGNTVIVIEHHLDVIKTADWVIDLGPEGGDGGGRVIAAGRPEELITCAESQTGRFLAMRL